MSIQTKYSLMYSDLLPLNILDALPVAILWYVVFPPVASRLPLRGPPPNPRFLVSGCILRPSGLILSLVRTHLTTYLAPVKYYENYRIIGEDETVDVMGQLFELDVPGGPELESESSMR